MRGDDAIELGTKRDVRGKKKGEIEAVELGRVYAILQARGPEFVGSGSDAQLF